MKFHLSLLGTEILSIEFAWPARGVYPVPDFFYGEDDFDAELEEEFFVPDEEED